MTGQPARRLAGEEFAALKFAAHRQLAASSLAGRAAPIQRIGLEPFRCPRLPATRTRDGCRDVGFEQRADRDVRGRDPGGGHAANLRDRARTVAAGLPICKGQSHLVIATGGVM